ncbi:SAM-dependent DNA methyltransferase [Deinococcus psychrotolerans]|uniref:site-specific DNA-methyltransferase (adenine-specific) n=1 Tax=Deinococcus psychrotolerans TaxID=2489213 RepID=A0A3G8YDF5_9DEIO|nr:class I SAM-dependent DNA methyltransferase [Deinococcus psychrotolerans]AZI43429.1 SAM-dependent DNA methyltransferase [Deinococcus psychrotolerans]
MTAPSPAQLVARVWNLAHVLRNDGVGYGDYLEQITFLLFLKMADEMDGQPDAPQVPEEYRWDKLSELTGAALESQYRHTLEELAKEDGLLGVIFRKAQNKINDPANLKQVVGLIGRQQWMGLGFDVKGEIYEGLLQRNAEDVKGGAGQYFTPRPLIDAVVEVVNPKPGETIADPACGTGGFLLSARDYLATQYNLDPEQRRTLRESTFHGTDIVDSVVRLAAMNMFLHGIGGKSTPVERADSLAKQPSMGVDIVLANPPFGVKGTMVELDAEGNAVKQQQSYARTDFTATTSNKQLNFLQHILTLLNVGGRAAVVVPDNVLFEAGAGETIRRRLLHDCNLHTILRLPTGIFYAQGVKANVLFFDRHASGETHQTSQVWVYDLRTNLHFTLKTRQMKAADLRDFVEVYHADDRSQRQESERFKRYTLDEVLARDKVNLDIFWLKDDSLEEGSDLPAPQLLAAEIVESLEAALEEFRQVADELGEEVGESSLAVSG